MFFLISNKSTIPYDTVADINPTQSDLNIKMESINVQNHKSQIQHLRAPQSMKYQTTTSSDTNENKNNKKYRLHSENLDTVVKNNTNTRHSKPLSSTLPQLGNSNTIGNPHFPSHFNKMLSYNDVEKSALKNDIMNAHLSKSKSENLANHLEDEYDNCVDSENFDVNQELTMRIIKSHTCKRSSYEDFQDDIGERVFAFFDYFCLGDKTTQMHTIEFNNLFCIQQQSTIIATNQSISLSKISKNVQNKDNSSLTQN